MIGDIGRRFFAATFRGWPWLLALLLGAAVVPAAGQPNGSAGIELQPATRQALARIQDQWLQWVGAFYQNDAARAEATAKELVVAAEELGMSRLPDLCVGVLARAVSSAREGNFERAHWALGHAERFDPGRPEIQFAAAAVALTEGSYLKSLGSSVKGLLRMGHTDSWTRLVQARLSIWLGGLLATAAGLFLVLEVATGGRRLLTDVAAAVGRVAPAWLVAPLTLLVLLWPLALPSGVLWLGLYLSVLLWGYCSISERIVLGIGWLLLALVPLGVASVERKVLVELQPPMRALDHVASGRLSGDLFTDLEALRSVLPDSVAVEHLLAEVYRRLGQWEDARSVYLRVTAGEPNNSAGYLALGAHYFRKADYGKAVDYFKRAVASDPTGAEAYYNLSLAYSEQYLFDESRSALGEARRLSEPKVAAWISQQSQEKMVLTDGGVGRIPEIRELLYAPHTVAAGRRLQLRRWLPIPLALAAALLAITLYFVRRRRNGYSETGEAPRFPAWLEFIVPGLAAARDGRGFAAAGGALLMAVILTLPMIERLTFVLPWRFEPGRLLLWVGVASLILAVFAIRFWLSRRET